MKKKGITYRDAGVDIAAGESLVSKIKPLADKTRRPEVLDNLGGFAGLFALSGGYKNPTLVSSTDGVGTKLIIALNTGKHSTIGIDLVAMCVNDIAVMGAEPLFFLDYLACGKLSIQTAAEIIEGISQGCTMANCSLLGGETAEMPGMYETGGYDLAGFTVGIVEKEKIIDGKNVREGDVVLGIKSSGLHSNGYSLVRVILENVFGRDYLHLGMDYKLSLESEPLLDLIMKPTKIYVNCISNVLSEAFSEVHAIAHITGGGPLGNITRSIPKQYKCLLGASNFPIPPLMEWLKKEGGINNREFFNVFNGGIGMTLVVKKEAVERISALIEDTGEEAVYLGVVKSKSGSESQIEIS
ncbi:phosphoribosylformylglycinamidine cyclo-ligase [Betaproteobacteria bacterium]|nr:phosphoribosylformylglycinamidine cyclo-ligase [Betaproteobacteria bacterium]